MNKLYALFFLGTLSLISVQSSNAEPAEKIRIGALAELTGPGAMNGAACQSGYRIAERLFSTNKPEIAKRVEIVYGDHKRDQKTALSEFKRLEAMGVWGVACNHSIVGVVINPLSRDSHIPLFGVMGHASFVKDNPFALRIIPTPEEEGGGLARMAYSRGARRAAILFLQDDYLLAIGEAFEKQFKALGGEVVYKDALDESLGDFSSIGTKIRSAKPDAIEMTLGFQQFGPAIKRLREQGVRQPIYSNYWLSYPQVIESAGAENVEGSVYITEKSDYPVFVNAYNEMSPGVFRAGVVFRCYTALATALSIISADPQVTSREEFAKRAQSTTSLDFPDRVAEFVDREVKFTPEYYELKNGKAHLIQ